MTEVAQEASPGRGKPTVAAAIFALAFVLSASMMVWSGWQLYHGESLPAAVTATGTQCDWVILLDEPAKAGDAWKVLEQAPDVPPAVRARLHSLAPLWQTPAAQGLNHAQAWTLCGAGSGAVLTVPTAPNQGAAAKAFVTELAGAASETADFLPWHGGAGAWQARGAVHVWHAAAAGHDVAAVQEDGAVVRIAWTQPGMDPVDALHRASATHGLEPKHLATDLAFRAATERVGNAPLHLYVPARTAQAWLTTLANGPFWREGIRLTQWIGVMVRLDDDKLRVHAQIGADEQGAAWLKESFDVQALDDASGWIAANATSAAIIRLPAKTRTPLAAWYGPHTPLFEALMATAPKDLPANVVIWQQFADGKEAALWRGKGDGPGGWQHALDNGWTLAGADAVAIARVRALLAGQSSTIADSADRDRRRLLAHTQGWFRGPLQFDWVWTDTGLAAEAAWQR